MGRGATFSETITEQFIIETCCNCGVSFAMTKALNDARLADKSTFHCPNGHPQSYVGKSYQAQINELKAEKIALQSRVESERENAEKERKAKERAKAETKRMTKRAAAGVCPYCNRSFNTERLQRHIHTKHPEKAHAAS